MYLIFSDIATARLLPSHPQAIGVTGAAWLPGNIALFSMNVVPSLLRSPTETNLPMTTLAKQWREIYETGKHQNPPVAAITAASFVLSRPAPYIRAGFYASAALLTLGIVPFTLVAMSSTNNALIADWVVLNRVRSLLPLLGSLTGIAVALL
ncbi:hypothetical protein BDW60DRAFT_218354 [Aspergillus nidulans var. acristatus]